MATNRRDRRKEPRIGLSVPVRVQGHSADAKPWEEMTTAAEASFGGTSFRLKRPVAPGQVLLLSLPLPKAFRHYDFSEPSYKVFGLVRDVLAVGGEWRIGVFFLGRNPPEGYTENPGARYLLPHDAPPRPKERRQFPRLQVFLNLRIQRAQFGSDAPQQELTVAENVSRRGARVMTSLPIAKGELLTVEEVGGGFRTQAAVVNIYIGKDRVPRLNLRFLADAPERWLAG